MDDLRLRFTALDSVAVPDLWADIERRASTASTAPAKRVTRRDSSATLSPAVILLIVGLLIAAVATAIVVGSWINQVVPPIQPTPTSATSAPSATATALSAPGARSSPNPSLLHCGNHFSTEQIADFPTLPRPAGSPSAGLLTFVGYSDQIGYWLDLIDPVHLTLARRIPLSDFIPVGEPGGIRKLSWSPDGGLLAFDTAGDCYDAFVMSADGMRVWHILDGSSSERFDAWGRDSSTWITTDAQRAADDQHVYVRTIATEQRTDLIREHPAQTGDTFEGALPRTESPDGRLMVEQVTPSRIEVVDLSTGVRSTIWRQSSGQFHFAGPIWSPDSKQIAFSAMASGDRDHYWYVVNADGSNVRTIDGTWFDVAWQPVWP